METSVQLKSSETSETYLDAVVNCGMSLWVIITFEKQINNPKIYDSRGIQGMCKEKSFLRKAEILEKVLVFF